MLFEPVFKAHFIDAIMECGDNGSQVYALLNAKKISVSYKTIHDYMRRLFGSYKQMGRPPKYFRKGERRRVG